MARTAKRIRFHHSRPAWQLAALLLAALVCLPSILLAQSPPPPATPASVTVTRSDGALTATWPAISDATKYHVTYSTDGGKSWHAPVDDHTNVTTTSIKFNADNAKTYIVGVRAGNDNDQWSDWRNSAPAGPYTPPNANPPGPVASVSLTRADGAVTADWPAASRATHYHVTYTTDNGESWSLAALNHTSSAITISKADNAKAYVVGVRAGNAHGWSGWRNSPAIGPYTPPVAPIGLTAARGNDGGTAGVSWTAYTGEGFEYYRVIVCNDSQYDGSACSGTVFASTPSYDANDTGPVTVPGLNAGTGYGIILQVWRNGSALKRHATLPAGPAAPANLSVTPGDGYLDIEWDAVTDATGYDVRAKKAGASDWHDVAGNITETSYRYTTTETMDYVAVRARNANGPGNWTELSRLPAHDWLTTVSQSGGASVQAASSDGAQAQNQLAAPTWGTITRDNGRKHILHLNWTAVTGASGYNVICSHSDGWSWWQCGSITSQSITTLTVNNGPNGTDLSRQRSYKVAVRAVNSNPSQASNWTNSENIRPVFRWLHDLTYTRADGQITLRWTPNFWTTGYRIDCAVAESGKVATYTRCATLTGQDDTAAQHSVTIPHSTNSTYTVDDTKTYDIRITSTNEWDTGGNAQMFAPLVYPSGLTASNVAQNAATITLAHATHTGDWHYQADKGPDATCQGPVSGTKTDVVGLAGGETYRYKAYSDRGCSTGSRLGTSAEFTTATLIVSNLTQDGATLTIAGDHASTWYYKRSGEASCLGPVSLASVNLTNLTAGTIYTYVSYSDSTCTPANLIATTSAFTTNGVSVSNLNQSVHTEICTVYSSSKCALGFTTGSNSTGYTLDVVTAEFLSVIGDPGDLVVTLHADNSGVPADASLATLSGSNPVANTRSGNYAYTCSGAGCTLSANTTYFMQFSATKGTDSRDIYGLATTLSDQQTLVPAGNGWSLADKMDYKTTGNWGEFDDVPKLTLVATTNAGGTGTGTGTAQAAPTVVATATVRGTASPLNPAGAAAQAANRAGSAANAHKGSGRGETAIASATPSPGYVTNLASAQSGDSDVDATQRQAVAFTTGPSPGGYTLKRFHRRPAQGQWQRRPHADPARDGERRLRGKQPAVRHGSGDALRHCPGFRRLCGRYLYLLRRRLRPRTRHHLLRGGGKQRRLRLGLRCQRQPVRRKHRPVG